MSSENMNSKPTIETVLDRINELGAKLETRMSSLETAVIDLRNETRQGFHKMERCVEVISGDIIKLRADLRYVHDRIDKLENAT